VMMTVTMIAVILLIFTIITAIIFESETIVAIVESNKWWC